jgi:flagellin-like hook-associated protein FlgL
MSYVAYNATTKITKQLSRATERLSSGLRVNSAADDAAGLAISEKMTAQIRGLDQASKNAQDGMSLLQTAEGALNEIHSMLQRMRELAVQAANGTLTGEDRGYIQLEVNELVRQISDIANQTQFNKKKLLNGDSAILWSTSTSDISVLVGGTLLKKDIFGQTQNAEGNYKITFETIQAGDEQVQKSNIFYLKHGTKDTDSSKKKSPRIKSFRALNMVEGVWRVETRDNPFGGVNYFIGNSPSNAAGVGAELDTGGISNLAPGEYDIRLSDNVPMMVDITNALAAGTVDDVFESSRARSSDFDAAFAVDEGISPGNSASQVYRNDIYSAVNNYALGTILADGASAGTFDPTSSAYYVGMDTYDANDINVFTRYEVTGTDARDLITADLAISAGAYTQNTDGVVNVNLDYQALTGSRIETTIDYVTTADEIKLNSTYYFDATDTFGFTIYDASGSAVTTVTPFAMGTHRTMADAAAHIGSTVGALTGFGTLGVGLDTNYTYPQNAGLEFDVDTLLVSGTPFDIGAHTIVFSGTVAEKNGFDGAYGARAGSSPTFPTGSGFLGTSSIGNQVQATKPKDSNFNVALKGLSGKTIDEVYDMLTNPTWLTDPVLKAQAAENAAILAEREISVALVPGINAGEKHLTFTSNFSSGPTGARYDITIDNSGLAQELGFGGTGFSYVNDTNFVYSGDKESGKILLDGSNPYIDVSGMNLDGIAGELNAVFAANGILSTSATVVSSGADLSQLRIHNGGPYKINFEDVSTGISPGLDGALEELFGADFSINKGGSDRLSAKVYNDANIIVAIPTGSSMSNIENLISSAITTRFAADDLVANNSTDLFDYDPLTGKIIMSNAYVSGYKVSINDNGDPAAIGQMLWGGVVPPIGREDNTSRESLPMGLASGNNFTITIANMDVWEALAHIKSVISAAASGSHPELVGLSVAWRDNDSGTFYTTPPPSTAAGNHNGQIVLVNKTGRAVYVTQTSANAGEGKDAKNRGIFDSNSQFAIANNANTQGNSNTLQAHDNITLEVNWEGNKSDGTLVSGTAGVVIWEGDTGPSNAAALNSATDVFNGLGGNFYQFFSTKDTVKGSDFTVGDSWIIYTSAAAKTNSDSVTVDLVDGKYVTPGNHNGVSNGIRYVFNNGALDGNDTILINQMIRKSNLDYEYLRHNIDFGSTITDTSFAYGERANGGDFNEWAMGGSRNATPYYAQAYYGEDTTYHIASGASIGSIVGGVNVNKMNDMNGSLLFKYNGSGGFDISYETFDRGGAPGSGTLMNVAASSFNNTPITIAGINFDGILINTAGLSANDMFVINVAAAAKLDTPATAVSGFESNENISIYANLSRSGGGGWDSRSQYRFANGGAEDGNYEGFIIDKLTGAVKSGILDLDILGLQSGSGVGNAGDADSDAYWIRAEVNNQGSLVPGAGGLVTSVYIQDLEKSGGQVIDYIPEIKYAEIKGQQNATVSASGMHNDYNASVIFDFLGFVDDDDDASTPDKARFRIQAHVMDINGDYAYIEDEEMDLVIGQNAASGQFVIFSAASSEPDYAWHETLPDFTGLYFDSFILTATWTPGDRFTLSLMASGAAKLNTPSSGVDTTMDEVTFISDLRGTALPHSFRFNNGAIDNKETDFHIYQLANNTYIDEDSVHFADDQVMDGTVSLGIDSLETNQEAVSFTSTFMKGIDAGVAHYYSRAEDVKQFWNANGVFLLENGPEKLTVKLGDKETDVYIYGNVELGKLARRMSEQIWLNLIQGQGEITEKSIDKDDIDDRDKDEIVQFVNSVPGQSANEAVHGTMLAHSVIPGASYNLLFSGSEEIMKAFAFREIAAAKDTLFEMTVYDAHSGRQVSGPTRVMAGQNINNLIAPGVSLAANAAIGVNNVQYADALGLFKTNLSAGVTFDRFVHLADNALVLQIGANQGEDTALVLGDVSAKALGIHNIEVRSRETAARSVTRIDGAIKKVSTQRAIIGAQINRLEHAVNAVTVASTNLSGARSKIKDIDFAKEMMVFTKLNILQQTGMSMQAQANQANRNVLALIR